MSRIFLIGWPSSLSHSINSIGMILLMSFVGVFGTVALAAFGVGIRLESLAIMPILGISSAVIPFIGQNLGAGRNDRVGRAVSLSSYTVIVFMLIISALWFFVPEVFYSPFSSDPQVLSIGADYFRIIAFGYVFLGLDFILSSALQAAGRTTLQMLLNMFRWAVTVIAAFVLVGIVGINGIWMGFPIGNFLGFLAILVIFRSGFWLKNWEKK